jgi:hypothetical protein
MGVASWRLQCRLSSRLSVAIGSPTNLSVEFFRGKHSTLVEHASYRHHLGRHCRPCGGISREHDRRPGVRVREQVVRAGHSRQLEPVTFKKPRQGAI